MPIIRRKDYWLVPFSFISMVLIALGQTLIGVCLFALSCILIAKIYGFNRVLLHIGLSGMVTLVLIRVI